MTTEKDFAHIAEAAYQLDPTWGNGPTLHELDVFPRDNPKFVVLDHPHPISDPVSGFQGAAIAPLLPNGKPDLQGMQLNRRVELKILEAK